MLRKLLFTTVAGCALAVSAMGAEVYVRVAPPHRIVEVRAARPGPEYVWVNGYHRWGGSAYVWVPGEWRRPPHRHAHWVDHRWEHRRDGYVFVEGHWR
jgi:hypothetical protein